MESKYQKMADSLRHCADVPIKCVHCVETFSVGCATRLRRQAADMIEELERELATRGESEQIHPVSFNSAGIKEDTPKEQNDI